GGDRVDGRPLVGGGVGPRGRGGAAGVDGEDGEVAVGVDRGDPALHRPAVGEGHLGRAVAEVVGVGDDEAVGHDDPAAAAAVPPDADDGGGDGVGDLADDRLLLWHGGAPPRHRPARRPAAAPVRLSLAICKSLYPERMPIASRRQPPPTALAGTAGPGAADRALARAAEVVGDRWSLLVVARLLAGPHRFGELLAEIDGLAPNILSRRLARLEGEAPAPASPTRGGRGGRGPWPPPGGRRLGAGPPPVRGPAGRARGARPHLPLPPARPPRGRGLVVGEPYSTRPVRHVYRLTARGEELAGALRMLAGWGAPHDLPAADPAEGPPAHGACGTPLEARWYCPTCDLAVDDPAPPGAPADDGLVWL